ncbi:acyl-CoA dehydrogenase [Rhodococcus sp. HNM0569]|nr:acyl-CoA dehydrogenase [Rhodococcus sp. HNM0569]
MRRLTRELDALHPLLQLEAEDGERLHRPTPAVQAALRESGVLRLLLPAELGGIEASPIQVLEVIEKLSYSDASIGWMVRALACETATAAVYLNDDAVAELFGNGDYPTVAGQSSSYVGGQAVREDGGYRVTGLWQFSPGVSMATHINLAVTVDDTGEELVCLVPRDALRIKDNWDMLGLRATASLDCIAEDLFVDDRHVYRIGREYARRGGLCGSLGPALVAGLNQAAWSQGVGRRLLDELKLRAQSRPACSDSLVTSDEFFAEFARHYSHVRGTMALLRETWTGNEETLRVEGGLTDEQETMSRLACSLANRTSLEIGQLVHRFAGAHVMRPGAIQRFFRDSHAGTQHRGSSHVVTQKCGLMLSGTLPAGSHWGFFDLVVPE